MKSFTDLFFSFTETVIFISCTVLSCLSVGHHMASIRKPFYDWHIVKYRKQVDLHSFLSNIPGVYFEALFDDIIVILKTNAKPLENDGHIISSKIK